MSDLILSALELKSELAELVEGLHHSIDLLIADFQLLCCLCLARIIVWRELRRERRSKLWHYR